MRATPTTPEMVPAVLERPITTPACLCAKDAVNRRDYSARGRAARHLPRGNVHVIDREASPGEAGGPECDHRPEDPGTNRGGLGHLDCPDAGSKETCGTRSSSLSRCNPIY